MNGMTSSADHHAETGPTLEEAHDDVALVFLALAAHVQRENEAHMRRKGFEDLRPSHGYVFQHLVTGPKSITQLARALEMTNQGASKAVIELEDLGYVHRRVSDADARARHVELTARGRRAIEASREARRITTQAMLDSLPERARPGFLRSLRTITDTSGALSTMFERRLRPPS